MEPSRRRADHFAWLLPFLAACVQVTEPAAPAVQLPEVSEASGSQGLCSCSVDDVKGRVYRVTSLEIDEPDAFAQLLNSMWEGDIHNNVLNVIFVLDDATQTPGSPVAFDSLTISAGPAWREPKWNPDLDPANPDPTNPKGYVIHAAAGQPDESLVDSYCQLEGLSVPLELRPYHGNQCTFKSREATSLYFHSGPMDAPLICAPQNTPANNIPIKSLKIRASFNRECTAIDEGYLEGCIRITDADRICMCPGVAGACEIAPTGTVEYDPDDPAKLKDYCHTNCSGKHISFGGLIRASSVPTTCITDDGSEGYRVQGFFTARALPEHCADAGQACYNPVSSTDCSKHAQ